MSHQESQTPANQAPESPAPDAAPAAPKPESRRHRLALAVILVAAAGVGAGATAIAQKGRSVTLVALTPAPIAAMKDGEMAAVKGEVAEIFGNKFILQDAGGRALVETGRRGEGADLVAKGQQVTVQGRFAHGFLHAAAIQGPEGRSVMLDPPPPPPRPRLASPGPDAPPPRP